jgi:hypothetical protein
MKISMLYSEMGVDFLAMRTVVVLSIAAALIAMAAVYVNGYAAGFSKDEAGQEVNRIAEAARAEYAESCPDAGDGISINVVIPQCVRRVVFGGSPGNNSTLKRDAEVYFIEYADGSCETHVLDARLAYGDNTGHMASDRPVVLYPGRYSLKVRASSLNGSIVAAIYGGAT